MRQIAVAALLIGASMLLCTCLAPGGVPEQGPIRIGIYGDLSGSGARDGNDALKGASLRIKEANAAGGVGGRMVRLVSMDTKQSPTESVRAYTSLAQDERVSAVIGSTVANAGLAVSPVADLVKVPLVSLSIDDRVTTPEWKAESPEKIGLLRMYVFMAQPTAAQMASALAAYAVDRFPLRRFATLYDPSSPVSVIQARAFEYVVRKAGKVVVESQELPQGGSDFAAPLTRIRDAGAEALYLCGTLEENAAAANQAKSMGMQPVLLGNQAWFDPFLLRAGSAAEGSWFSMGMAPDDPAFADLAVRYRAEYGDPPRQASLLGWDAAGLVLTALAKAGTDDPRKVRDALESVVGWKALTGTIDMERKTHRPVAIPIAIMRIHEGAYEAAELRYTPPARALAP
jgi:branched-chain amino acid transport system substrate-binding protein